MDARPTLVNTSEQSLCITRHWVRPLRGSLQEGTQSALPLWDSLISLAAGQAYAPLAANSISNAPLNTRLQRAMAMGAFQQTCTGKIQHHWTKLRIPNQTSSRKKKAPNPV